MIQSSESFADVLCSTILEDNVSNVHVCTCNRTYEHVEKEQIDPIGHVAQEVKHSSQIIHHQNRISHQPFECTHHI